VRTPVSFGVIGSGDWGRRVARTVEHLPGTQLRWECDAISTTRLHERRGIATARFGSDIARLLGDDTLDAVVVAPAASSH
jgi:predicted dehydrogenase